MSDTQFPRLILIVGLALIAMGQTVLFAIFGPLGREMGMSEVMVGGVISTAAVAVVLASPWWGRQVDRKGRRPVFLFSLAGLGCTTLIFVAALEAGRAGWIAGLGAFAALAITRVIYGLSVTGAQPAAAAWIADTTSEADRTGGMAVIGAAFGVGTILGPVLAWVLSGTGLLTPLYAVAGAALLVGALAWRKLPEPPRVTRAAPARLALRDPRIAGILVTLVCVFTVISTLQQTLAFYVQDTGGLSSAETAARVGQALALLAAVVFVTQAGVAIRKPPARAIMLVGLPIAMLGSGILLIWPEQPGVLLSHAILGLGMGLVVPGLQGMASLAVRDDEQGAVGGLVAAAMAGGFAIGPVLGTGLYSFWPRLPYVMATGLLFGALLLSSRSGYRNRSRPQKS